MSEAQPRAHTTGLCLSVAPAPCDDRQMNRPHPSHLEPQRITNEAPVGRPAIARTRQGAPYDVALALAVADVHVAQAQSDARRFGELRRPGSRVRFDER